MTAPASLAGSPSVAPGTGSSPGSADRRSAIGRYDAPARPSMATSTATQSPDSRRGAHQYDGDPQRPTADFRSDTPKGGLGVFLTVLAHKAESAGRELIAVDPANTSHTCARCAMENRVAQAEFACRACGHTAHADVNAAINILRAGLALRKAAEATQREAAPFRERRSHGGVYRDDHPSARPAPRLPERMTAASELTDRQDGILAPFHTDHHPPRPLRRPVDQRPRRGSADGPDHRDRPRS
ncbi:transposase [Microtetraspora fusca]|uniref:transposase n=1 Tax=Microtetraspora fusca TaxID=1997 RepID=UPI00278C3EC0|nr:transposase [Microtetraspora fusca]